MFDTVKKYFTENLKDKEPENGYILITPPRLF